MTLIVLAIAGLAVWQFLAPREITVLLPDGGMRSFRVLPDGGRVPVVSPP